MSNFLLALTLLSLTLAGCGGDELSISSSNSLTNVPFSGVVEDGPIAGAKISLRDKGGTYYPLYDSQGNANYEIKTDTNGAFALTVNAETDFFNLSVVAVGGIDRDTGMDFSGLEMRCPLGLYQGDMTTIVVSPLTTLVAELHDQGFSFEEAETLLSTWLALSPDVNLAATPSTNLDLQRHTLLLSKIALLISEGENDVKPFNRIAMQILTTEKFMVMDASSNTVTVNSVIMSALGLNALAQSQISDLKLKLDLSDDLAFVFKREELMHVFEDNFKEVLELSSPFDVQQNLNYQQNVETLIDKTLSAAGSEVILLANPIPSRLFRYVFFTYLVSMPESLDQSERLKKRRDRLSLDPLTFSATLTHGETDLKDDPWVALLARSSSANSVDSPLLLTELPGDDNQKRIDYFSGSDISPHYRAEQLIGRVFDDAINDAILLKIVEGKANAGIVKEVQTIIATQIVQTEQKAHAYLALAKALIKLNQPPEESLRALDKARDLYRTIIESKGKASAIGDDVFNLLETSRYYRDAGDFPAAQSLLSDIAAIAEVLKTDATTFGRLITGYKRVADVYISAGNLDAAALLVDEMYDYSLKTPADPITYKLRILNLSECAKRYADLGNKTKLLEVFSQIQDLRNIVGSPEANFWTPVITLVESLYRVGEAQQALTLANTLPSTQTSAFKLVATYEALQGNLERAFSIVDNTIYFPKVEDKIELLTYFSNTRHYIGLKLINAGRFVEARQALEKAENLLDSMTASNNLVRISNGYVKVAELYTLMGDKTKAVELMQRAEGAISADIYRVTVMVDIALGYHNLNQTSVALDLLDNAQGLADVDPTLYRAEIYPNLGKEEYATRLYEKLVKAYEKIREKSRVRTIIVNSFQPWAEKIHTTNTVNDSLAGKECDYLLSGALYLDRAGYHGDALNALNDAKSLTTFTLVAGKIVGDVIAVPKTFLAKYLSVVTTYTKVLEYDEALLLALALPLTTERNQAIQTLANAYIDRDDFPDSDVASIDSDGDGRPDFFHPLASAEEIAASGLIMDDDSDGDGIVDTLDFRPLFDDRSK